MARQALKQQAEVSPAIGGIAGDILRKPGRSYPICRSVAVCTSRDIPQTSELTLPRGLRLLFDAFSLSDENLRN